MKISGPKRHKQHLLFDRPNRKLTHGLTRVIIGGYFEQLSADYLNGRICIDNAKYAYCPDIICSQGYFESKAVGISNQLMVYADRLTKDSDFVGLGHQLHYIIWSHSLRTKGIIYEIDLLERLGESINCVYVVPFAELRTELLSCKLCCLNGNNYGEGSSSGRLGYRASLSKFTQYRKEYP